MVRRTAGDEVVQPGAGHPFGRLGPGCVVLQERRRRPGRRRAGVDLVVVGRGGVFAVCLRAWPGTVSVDPSGVRLDGVARPMTVAAALEAAAGVAKVAGPYADQVRPVLCLLDQTGVHGQVGTVLVTSPDDLATVLRRQPVVLGPRGVEDVARRLQRRLVLVPDPVPAPVGTESPPAVPEPSGGTLAGVRAALRAVPDAAVRR